MNKATPELLPCPFCGEKVHWIKSHVLGEGGHIVHAKNVNCITDNIASLYPDDDMNVIKRWNTRTQPSLASEGKIKCEDCGKEIPKSIIGLCLDCGGDRFDKALPDEVPVWARSKPTPPPSPEKLKEVAEIVKRDLKEEADCGKISIISVLAAIDVLEKHFTEANAELVKELEKFKKLREQAVDYSIALQRAIEAICANRNVPPHISKECPHLASKLNDKHDRDLEQQHQLQSLLRLGNGLANRLSREMRADRHDHNCTYDKYDQTEDTNSDFCSCKHESANALREWNAAIANQPAKEKGEG